MSDELKPCAHCEGEGYAMPPNCDKKTPYDPTDRAYPVVTCRKCYASVPGENWDQSMRTAIEKWNRRAGETV